jgi:hypothetical protein
LKGGKFLAECLREKDMGLFYWGYYGVNIGSTNDTAFEAARRNDLSFFESLIPNGKWFWNRREIRNDFFHKLLQESVIRDDIDAFNFLTCNAEKLFGKVTENFRHSLQRLMAQHESRNIILHSKGFLCADLALDFVRQGKPNLLKDSKIMAKVPAYGSSVHWVRVAQVAMIERQPEILKWVVDGYNFDRFSTKRISSRLGLV